MNFISVFVPSTYRQICGMCSDKPLRACCGVSNFITMSSKIGSKAILLVLSRQIRGGTAETTSGLIYSTMTFSPCQISGNIPGLLLGI